MSGAKKIVLLGTGGHCMSVLDSLLLLNEYEAIGLIGKKENIPMVLLGVPIIGDDNDLIHLHSKGYTDAFIAIGSIGDISLRKRLYQYVKNIGFHVPNIIDKSSVVSNHASLGEGIYIGKNAVINAGSSIGTCAIVNTSSVVEHECRIGDFVHIAPGALLSGNIWVGENTHIGAGSMIKQGIHIGTNSMVGMGSVVLKDIGDNVLGYGNPCKEVEYLEESHA